jgi:hypothetical protein
MSFSCQKKEGVPTPSSLRPVPLQSCSMKSICKTLTSRLQLQIGNIIDMDQSGFLKGRSISENSVYAAELVQTCYRRKASCLVLNFMKAFDSIDWRSLRRVMLVRGFPSLWYD